MDKRLLNLFLLIFTLSGFSGLIYESIWTHYLKLFMGHAAYAQTLVLAIFMSGLAMGSWICSRYSVKWKNLLISYALAEGAVGLFALVFHNAFDQAVQISYASILPHLDSASMAYVYKWTLSALMILPQSILLGMTFPLMSAGLIRLAPQNPGRTISLLYFTNSIGAAIGVLVSGFILIRLIGLPWTIRLAGLINVALALSVWLLVRRHSMESAATGIVSDNAREYPDGSRYYFFLFASFITGAASFIYEIGWIRMLSLVLGSSTHAFELMLSAFILGLAFGGLWMQRRIEHIKIPERYLAYVQVTMGLLALSTLLLYGYTFEVMQWLVTTLSKTDTGYTLFNLSSNAIAMAVMLPTTFCAGMTLPLITFTLIRRGSGERSIGAVYAANTAGAILGVFFAIHFGMPLLGLRGLITAGAGLDLSLGVLLLWGAARYTSKRVPLSVTALCMCAVAATLFFVQLDPYKMASGIYRQGSFLAAENSKLLYHEDGKTATVSVALMSDGIMSIRTNGKPDAGIYMGMREQEASDEDTMVLAAVIPMALNPQATDVATIGFGSGLTSHTLLSNPLFRQVDTIEIEKNMVEASNNFRPRVELVYRDPRSKIFIDDAKTFFSVHNKKYDLIVSEPSNPWVSGVAGLFSEEFYCLINRYLTKNGLFAQWVQLYEIDTNMVVSILKAVSSNFSDFVVYATTDGNILIIAKNNGTVSELDPGILKIPDIDKALQKINIKSVQDIEIRKIGSKKLLQKMVEAFPIRANSDYYPVLDQNAARTRFLNADAQELLGFAHEPIPVLELLSGTAASEDNTSITPSPFFSKTQGAKIAETLRDYFQHGEFNGNYGEISLNTKQQAMRLKQMFTDCQLKLGPRDRFASLFITAIRMTSYLKPHELGPIWEKLESGQCAKTLSITEKKWVALFKAVGKRDARTMASIARDILESEQQVSSAATQYLVACGMSGSLMQGDREGSLKLWSTYQSRLFGAGRPPLLFQLLAANSAVLN